MNPSLLAAVAAVVQNSLRPVATPAGDCTISLHMMSSSYERIALDWRIVADADAD
jgi:hypothetical protein